MTSESGIEQEFSLRDRVEVVRTDAATIRPLRHAVLRPGRPEQDSVYREDDDPRALHLVARYGGNLVGCCTVVPNSHPELPGAPCQLRGMAVAPDWRSRGIGRMLLGELDALLAEAGISMVWCNARMAALEFYLREGWTAHGASFTLVGLPHVVMWRAVPRNQPSGQRL